MTSTPRTLLTALVLAAALPAVLSAVPAGSPSDPKARQRAALTKTRSGLLRERNAIIAHLDDRRAALLVARTRRDAAQERYDDAVRAVNERLSQLYRQPSVGVVGQVLLGDLQDAPARVDLERAIIRHDRQTVTRMRRAYVSLRIAQQEITAIRAELAKEVQDIDVEIGAVEARLLKLPKPKPTFTGFTPATSLGPVYGPYIPGYEPPVFRLPIARGLPAATVARRALPGGLAIDPTTGRPVPIAQAPRVATPAASSP